MDEEFRSTMDNCADTRTLLIVPALNESANIGRVLVDARRCLPGVDLLVIDDGSCDGTAAVARSAGAMVLSLPYNLGIGAAVQTGFAFADRHGYDCVLRSDGDGQHGAWDLRRLLVALQTGDCDVVTGTRFGAHEGDRSVSPGRRVGIVLLAGLLSLITGQRISDPTSGQAGFSRRAVRLFAREYPHDYPEPEGLVQAHRAGLRMRELPVTMRPRRAGRSSIGQLDGVYYMIKVTLAIFINLLRPPQPH
ncbi:MAG: glycosyltransferase family 2 protein [Anaerolineaceae bacterium]|nr:glycosyltransferase family 2 protein [Anaerolineaceae bacterium]MDE0328608.1 glycosyltransferase family 2 protein [Anaerolineaceae bacterium]